ncbi:hypothetical protein VTJ83DRAFT_2135 [Remersonia thermophila]|uniref:RNB domain-containing protein n=1 Tax=Remersonia thermophila TaxID=72144 RepID=A0ABR4DI49_9PEZI
MMRRGAHNYVCWRCLAFRPADSIFLPTQVRTLSSSSLSLSSLSSSSSPTSSSTSTSSTTWTTTPVARPARLWLLSRTLAPLGRSPLRSASTDSTARSGSSFDWSPVHASLQASRNPNSIRERLKKWEAENPVPALAMPADEPAYGVGNMLTRPQSEFAVRVDLATEDDHDTTHFDGADMVDAGLEAAVLSPGDLVEVNTGTWKVSLLAILLGRFNGHLHFYTHTGKWFTCRNIRSGFVVKGFIQDPAELQAVINAIPSLSASETVLNQLQDLNLGPSRDVGASLIRRMYKFQAESRLIHQTYVERLSRASAQLGSEEKILSLREITDLLLPASLKRNKGAFPPEALYAVHSVIENEDIAFRALNRGARHHEGYPYALYPAAVQANVIRVEEMVRQYCELLSQAKPSSRRLARGTAGAFTEFLQQARKLIDRSREQRAWSPYGMLGPRKKDAAALDPSEIPAFSDTGLALLRFIEHWAACDGFRPGSEYHWIGASILRLVDRYPDALLDASTGWTFLQEIGWLPPWDVSARHALRLPEQKIQRHMAEPEVAGPAELGPDRVAHLRQDFARSTVYCIDSADTLDVDDGISLEAAGAGKYWIHVHVADPASRLAPDSELAKLAAVKSQSSYLAGFQHPMLDHPAIREAFSLGPNQPTLTFSALVDEDGHLLDSKITPGTLRDVVYITPEDVASVVEDTGHLHVPPQVLEVGARPAAGSQPARRMAKPADLSKAHRHDLKTLSKLAAALQRNRVERGALPAYPPKPKATVSLDGVSREVAHNDLVFYNGDPYIRVAYDNPGNPLVSSIMQLAGEVGARWCYERDIPIPYRVQLNTDRESAEALRAFTNDVLLPQLAAGKNPPRKHWDVMMNFVGGFAMTTTPGPNLIMGLDLYTKVTSPLRRYPDLVVHWQIEAALLEEHQRGRSLAIRPPPGGRAEDAPAEAAVATAKEGSLAFLPFSRKALEDAILPRLRIRERHSRLTDNFDGNGQWILQALVRAWRFGDVSPGAPPLPRTFRYTVTSVTPRRTLKGELDWFDRPAVVELEHLNDVVRLADIKAGDVFEVELADVNVRDNRICAKLLRRIEQAKREEEESTGEPSSP